MGESVVGKAKSKLRCCRKVGFPSRKKISGCLVWAVGDVMWTAPHASTMALYMHSYEIPDKWMMTALIMECLSLQVAAHHANQKQGRLMCG